jgi:tRNA 5-methylaminomethyl-2-thiouridine biosynthesis bifunctional protein
VIGETGFGTGLNFLAAWQAFDQHAPAGATLIFATAELYPLHPDDLQKALAAFPVLAPYAQALGAQYNPAIPGRQIYVFDGGRIQLHLYIGEVWDAFQGIPYKINHWFLDGFAPSKNPDMWRPDVLQMLADLSAPQAKLATFTAAGFVKRGLAAVGFDVRKEKGFGWKRDMLYAVYAGEQIQKPYNATPWLYSAINTISSCPKKRVAIVGSGIAAALLRRNLMQMGQDVVTFEKQAYVGQGGSGNPRGLVMPKVSLSTTADALFHNTAYDYAVRFYNQLAAQIPAMDWTPCGVLQCLDHVSAQDAADQIQRTIAHLGWSADRVQYIPADEIVVKAGLSLPDVVGAYWFPEAGWLRPAALVPALFQDMSSVYLEVEVTHIVRTDNGRWCLRGRKAGQSAQLYGDFDAIVVCAGAETRDILGHVLPMQCTSGQISLLRRTPETAPLGCNLSFGAYMSPADSQGLHVLGATFNHVKDITYPPPQQDWHVYNLAESNRLRPQLFGMDDVVGGRVSYRSHSPDRNPVVGIVPDLGGLETVYEKYAYGVLPQRLPTAATAPNVHQQGLYVCAGLGARGLLTAPLLSLHLAQEIVHGTGVLDVPMMQALYPGRFALRDIRRRKSIATAQQGK